ncbi:hypothetical protein MED92_11834 [Oceanospirillum sp. MED92]|uniref:Amidohydrolase 3 domain-containing protein n=1 Tax=Neptuniibacter caesariensis TaxID=207954 RepID=A0A7U8GQC6_NEPCE|nr:hypothetical protein MED92_11834 [Oceanospirillum sp. MED92] [Neptuniibacter caesariensis]
MVKPIRLGGAVKKNNQSFAQLTTTLFATLLISGAVGASDLVLTNGKILTVDSLFSEAQAIAIDGGRIVAIGSNASVAKHIKADTKLIDLNGKTVIPGLIDNHMHLVRGAQNWQRQIRLEGVLDYQEALSQIEKAAKRAKPGEWLTAPGGFVERQFDGRPGAGFLRKDLDRVAPENPVYLQHLFDWGYANSAALERIGVNPENPEGMAGLLLDNQGLPEGPVTKRAQWLIEQQVAQDKQADQLANAHQALSDLAKTGLTTVVDAGGFNTVDSLYAPFQSLDEQGELPIRLYYMKQVVDWQQGNRATNLQRLDGVRFGEGSDFFKPVAVGEQLLLSVQDTAGSPANSGDAVKAEFLEKAAELAKRGVQLHLHAVNDQSINQHLDAFAEINKTYPLAPLRWTLAHVDGIQPETIDRANDLGILFAIHSRPVLIGYRFQSRFGPKANQMTPMKTLTEKGALWGLGSDSPTVSIYNPFRTLWWAINGRMVDGTKVSEQNVDRKQALIAHTINNARLANEESNLGSLEIGKRADLVVIDQDYMKIEASQISKIRSLATMVDGEWVYRDASF